MADLKKPNARVFTWAAALALVCSVVPAMQAQYSVRYQKETASNVFSVPVEIDVFNDDASTPAETYDWNNGVFQSYGNSPTPGASDTTKLFWVENLNGLYLYVVHDVGADADGGDATTSVDVVVGPSVSFVVEDDPSAGFSDTYTAGPATSLTATQSWSAGRTDGYVVGPLPRNAAWTVDFSYDEAPTGISSTLIQGDGSAVGGDTPDDLRYRFSFVPEAQEPVQGPVLTTCTATAVPPVVRAEGIAELVGDIVLSCVNSSTNTPDVPNVVTNISVSLNVRVTNNINFGAGTNVTDAVLILNENNCEDPASLGSTFSCGPDARFQDPQFGTLAANNRLEWNEVTFPVPNGDPLVGADHPAVTTVRITAMRGNASQLAVPTAATFPSTQITAFVSITGPTTIPVTNNVLNVAVPILGLIVEGGTPVTGLQCLESAEQTTITLIEGFATSFKTQGVATYVPGNTQWESGYYAPGSNNGAGASQGTRFLLRFFSIPEAVDVSVPTYVSDGTPNGLKLHLVDGANADGENGSVGDGTPGTEAVTISGGFGYAVYEVMDCNPFALEEVDIPIYFEWEPDTANDLPAVGTGTMSATFAPISTVTTASASEKEPRFLDNQGDPEPIITIVRCTTTLLFPFVSNQAGFDTGLAISNTSEDWLGTDPQDGACDIHYHGSTTGGGAAPPTQTSSVIEAGDQLIFVLSGGNPAQGIAGAPDFQGYIIAVCEFQYGHGFAFITDGFEGIPALAQGYLALVIPVDITERIPGVPNLHRFGEALNH